MRTRFAGVLLSATVLAVLVAFFSLRMSRQGEGENGVGLTYRGEFYAQSGAEVRADRLGPVLEHDVDIRDTTTDVRAITGIDPDAAVAAWIRDAPAGPSKDGAAWLLMSRDDDKAVDPWSDPQWVTAVHPHERDKLAAVTR